TMFALSSGSTASWKTSTTTRPPSRAARSAASCISPQAHEGRASGSPLSPCRAASAAPVTDARPAPKRALLGSARFGGGGDRDPAACILPERHLHSVRRQFERLGAIVSDPDGQRLGALRC